MRSNILKTILGKSGIATAVLMLASGVALAQQQVNLTAGAATALLPDGAAVPMWGYSCGAAVSGSTATCAALKPGTVAGMWSPVVITVPSGQTLQINLTNALSFSNGNSIPTSLTIVGQLGGGLGTPGGSTASPAHAPQTLSWPASSTDPADPVNAPPGQPARVRSFGTEVAAGNTASLTWTTPRPGTYLLESGSHPSIQGPMGLYGIVVVTDATTGTAYPGVTYSADVPLLFSEIDPVQNTAVSAAVNTAGFNEATVWSGQAPDGCGYPGSLTFNTCYPPAVNYTPLYFMINGVAFDKSNGANSLFATAPATGVTGNVLVRLVNAGLRMHVPSIVGAQTGTASGFGLIAEDGNPLPGVTRVQSEVFMAPGKTYDVMITAPATVGTALPIFDRQGSLSANANARDAGMLAYIGINGAALPGSGALTAAVARADTYNSVIDGHSFSVSDASKGVIGNDTNVSGVQVLTAPAGGTLVLNANGTFSYKANSGTTSDSFVYCANGTVAGSVCSSGVTATVTLGGATIEAASAVTCAASSYTSTVATSLSVKPSGVLAACKDVAGYPLTVNAASVTPSSGLTVNVDATGGFNATVAAPGTYTFTYKAQNSQGTVGAAAATVTLNFPTPSGLAVTLVDGVTKAPLAVQDYRWIIEEDRTFFVDPNCQTNPLPAGCPTVTAGGGPAVFGTNFHTSYMPVVAQGCVGDVSCEGGQTFLNPATGTHDAAACDIGNGICRAAATKTALDPGQVVLDPLKHYYISVLPGDAMDPGHGMGGAQIAPGQTVANVIVEPQLPQASKLSVFVFEDDHPLNGEHDAGGGIDTLSPNEPGLGGFNVTIFDLVGGTGDSAGQLTYDEFGQPLSNSLAGTIDPTTQQDACPITANPLAGFDGTTSELGITGVIPVCPNFEADGTTLSPLGGQAVVANLPPGKYGIVATPGADRIAQGEEWLQTNTLDGGKDLETFLKANEPSYFQEFGPAGYHVSMGFANPQWINDWRTTAQAQGTGPAIALCPNGANVAPCNHTVSGLVTGVHMSRPSDERLYGTGTRDTFGYTQCFVSLGSADGADISFSKCDPDTGEFTLNGIPTGDWRVTIFDQWNDQIVDGITTPVRVGATNVNMGEVAVHAWKNNLTTRTCIDVNKDGVCTDDEPGLPLVPTNIRFRDGSVSNLNSTDLDGNAGFNEVFPLFSWYVLETDSNRYKNTGTHVINDAGGPVDGSTGPYACGQSGFPACGTSSILAHYARTNEDFPLPTALQVPGAHYCGQADCAPGDNTGGSTGRVDPAWVTSYGWQSFAGQNQYLGFGKTPFPSGENGGIHGHVVYASTRPFDDPALLLQLTWEPMVPHVTINLYQVGTAPDGSQSLTKVDSTQTSSWDDWAQGHYPGTDKPYMSCPGQNPSDIFFYTLAGQPNYLDWYNAQHGGPAANVIPNNSQYKCYDGMHMWNQLEPAPYDGMYKFPSIAGRNPTSGVPVGGTGAVTGTDCTICTLDSDGNPMLPAGKYVVEMIVPNGYELVKEEDKNILLGDTYEAPVTSQFAGFGNIFILPDQASVAAYYNPNNALNATTNLGADPRHEGDTGSVETFWPCVGTQRVVPDFNSLYPLSGQNSAFAGATRPLCDRKLVTLTDQMTVLAKFYVFSSTHVAGHFTGVISDDFTSEFDPFSPHFGEKFSPPNLPVSVKDHDGNEISRVYSDIHGIYNGLSYSSFSVNPPDPSGYIPQMMVICMNDRGKNPAVADPLYQSAYSQFCYELPFMPGQTGYFDTPVIPTASFAAEYNHPDCAYPDATPAISRVDGSDGPAVGPWVSASGAGHTLTIQALGNQDVTNYGFSGPKNVLTPFNKRTITRHYGFGGTQGTGNVTIGGVTAAVNSWSDTSITVTVPAGVANCTVQQQAQYGGSAARCGELVVTAGNGKQSVDAITVTIGGKAPTVLGAGQSIQSAIDAAAPGDLIMVPPGTYSELLVMWKPVRLQGVGAASSIIDGNAHPSGKLNDWRARIVCLFGLSTSGTPSGYDPATCGAGWNFFRPTIGSQTGTVENPQVDRLPLEATVGWTATLNGNLAEQLQEPSLMGAYEGAAITVLSKGVRFPVRSDPFAADTFPAGTSLLIGTATNPLGISTGDGNTRCHTRPGNSTANQLNPFPSNFQCNPSRIDGLAITNSSQGGGGIFVHGWAHNLEISNNRIFNNQGTLGGGVSIGQGEHPDAYVAGGAVANPDPGSCRTDNGLPNNTQLPYCFDVNVSLHHNAITNNSSEGDELFSATPSGAGGAAFCTGDDYYKFNYNWVCGNLSTGDGAGLAQLGFVYHDGNDPSRGIQHNTILFNQATNPTTPSNGGGVLIMSAPDTDPICPGEPDVDCNHAFGSVGDGVGPNLLINANLIMGNAAEAGSGGGIRFQGTNGSEVSTFPLAPIPCNNNCGNSGRSPGWYQVRVTNNIITNNVAGWDGAGVSLQDSLFIDLVNNTIVSNDSTASSGTLFGAQFATQASAPTPCPRDADGANIPCIPLSEPQPSGISSATHTAEFLASLPTNIRCPAGHGAGGTGTGNLVNGYCRAVSYPIIYNDIVRQNRAFNIVVTVPASDAQQASVALVPTLNQGSTGQCVTTTSYWDLGLRGDTTTAGGNHLWTAAADIRFTPQASVLTSTTGYAGGGAGFRTNSQSDPLLVKQYCNGAKVPPEAGVSGFYAVPPGTQETNVPVPIFNLTAGATVDEGNNWINISWGPLSLVAPLSEANPSTESVIGNYALSGGSPAINYITNGNSATTYAAAPATDFFEAQRKTNSAVDAGAIEFAPPNVPLPVVTPTSLTFSNVVVGTTSTSQALTLTNNGGVAFTITNIAVTAPFNRAAGGCGATLAAGASCAINVTFSPTGTAAASGTVTISGNATVTNSPVALNGTAVAAVAAATLTPTTWSRTCTNAGGGCGALVGANYQAFVLTNTGNVTLTGITQGVLGGTNANQWTIAGLLSTCGPAGAPNGQLLGTTSLAPGNSCAVTVRFAPTTAGVKGPATVSVTNSAGTQSSTLNGTRN